MPGSDFVAAALLGEIKGLVGAGEQVIDVLGVVGVSGDAKGGGEADLFFAIVELQVFEGFA